MHIIGLTGLPRSGKDSVAQEIMRRVPGGQIVKFADKLYAEVSEATGVPVAVLESDTAKRCPGSYLSLNSISKQSAHACRDGMEFIEIMMELRPAGTDHMDYRDAPRTSRDILRWWGTEFRRRNYGEDYWSDDLEARLQALRDSSDAPKYVIVTDTRFDNEAEMLQSLQGVIVEIRAPGEAPVAVHASDMGVSGELIDLFIYNVRSPVSAAHAGVVRAVDSLAEGFAAFGKRSKAARRHLPVFSIPLNPANN